MRILIADQFSEQHLQSLRDLGLEVDYRPGLDKDGIAGAIAGAKVLVVRGTEVKALSARRA